VVSGDGGGLWVRCKCVCGVGWGAGGYQGWRNVAALLQGPSAQHLRSRTGRQAAHAALHCRCTQQNQMALRRRQQPPHSPPPPPPLSHARLAKGVERDRGEGVLLGGPGRAQRGQGAAQRMANTDYAGGAQPLQAGRSKVRFGAMAAVVVGLVEVLVGVGMCVVGRDGWEGAGMAGTLGSNSSQWLPAVAASTMRAPQLWPAHNHTTPPHCQHAASPPSRSAPGAQAPGAQRCKSVRAHRCKRIRHGFNHPHAHLLHQRRVAGGGVRLQQLTQHPRQVSRKQGALGGGLRRARSVWVAGGWGSSEWCRLGAKRTLCWAVLHCCNVAVLLVPLPYTAPLHTHDTHQGLHLVRGPVSAIATIGNRAEAAHEACGCG
jgi:hypothetical protein